MAKDPTGTVKSKTQKAKKPRRLHALIIESKERAVEDVVASVEKLLELPTMRFGLSVIAQREKLRELELLKDAVLKDQVIKLIPYLRYSILESDLKMRVQGLQGGTLAVEGAGTVRKDFLWDMSLLTGRSLDYLLAGAKSDAPVAEEEPQEPQAGKGDENAFLYDVLSALVDNMNDNVTEMRAAVAEIVEAVSAER